MLFEFWSWLSMGIWYDEFRVLGGDGFFLVVWKKWGDYFIWGGSRFTLREGVSYMKRLRRRER